MATAVLPLPRCPKYGGFTLEGIIFNDLRITDLFLIGITAFLDIIYRPYCKEHYRSQHF
jgi:hypothetical protein